MKNLLLFCILSLAAATSMAAEPRYNQIDFNVEASREVVNDLMSATMSYETNDIKPVAVAADIASTINDALNTAAIFKLLVKSSSGNQSTYPVYGRDRKIETWRGHAEINIQSRDFKSMGELISRLQDKMQLGNVQFTASDEVKKKAEDTLTAEAIESFKKRAKTISDSLGGTGYRIVHMSISHNGSYVMPMARMAMASAAVPAQQFQGGDSTVNVQVSGTIEVLQPDSKNALLEQIQPVQMEKCQAHPPVAMMSELKYQSNSGDKN